jgi:hypothetical protein
MTKFRKRPVVIEAVQVPECSGDERFDASSIAMAPAWFHHALGTGVIGPAGDGGWHVNTLEGKMKANPGDYIICGIKGELYPCKPDIFEATYERAA